MDVTNGAALPLDSTRTCHDPECGRWTLLGEATCPVHLGLLSPDEMPLVDLALDGRNGRAIRAILLAAAVAVLGMLIGVAVGDTRFGWLGGVAGGSVVAGFVARELRFARLGATLGLLGFFAAAVLVLSGLLVASIAALPLIVDKLVG